jgi:hypothetical protein
MISKLKEKLNITKKAQAFDENSQETKLSLLKILSKEKI